MTKPDRPENQHYIPQFVLRLFGHGPGQGLVWRYDKTTDRITVGSVRKSAVAPDYYAINHPARGRDVELERVFGLHESRIAPLIKQLARLEPEVHELARDARDAIAGHLALQYARVPATRDQTWAMAAVTVAAETDMLLRHPEHYRARSRAVGATDTDEDLERQRLAMLADYEARRLVIEPPPEAGLAALGVAVDGIRPILAGMRWDIYRRGRFPYFVLGDQPVTISPPKDLPGYRAAGFATPGVEIFAPLSPDALLVATHEPHDGRLRVFAPDDRPVTPSLKHDWSLPANILAVLSATRYVFGRSQGDLEAVRLAIDPTLRGQSPKIRVTGMPKEWVRYLPEGFDVESVEP
ncbi:MAG: DUF4238 domain-containing protein [Chloroflexi bacterium]|nr:DUF4238 domain-containing protein [Chloroflexota bacterium]